MKRLWSVPAAAWWQRSLNLGLVLGLSLGTLRLIGAALGSRLSLVDAVSGTLASLGLYVIAFGVAGLLTSSRWHLGRLFAVALLSSLSALLVFTNVLSTVLHWMSGTYLTVGSIAFTVNSWSHVAGAAMTNYTVSVLTLFAVTALVMFGSARYLVHPQALALRAQPDANQADLRAWLRRIRRGVAIRRSLMIVGCSLFAYAVFATDGHFAKTLRAASPELTLIASWQRANRTIVVAEEDEADAGGGGVAEAHADWKAQARRAADGLRPNVLLVMLESVAPRWLGPNLPQSERDHRWPIPEVDTRVESITPHLDQLKRGGVHFTRAWSTATHSNYAQMAILSSLFPRRGHGLDVYDHLDYPRMLLHDVMNVLGYETATISSQDENWQGMLRFQQTETDTFFFHSPDHDGAHVFIGSEHIVPDHMTRERAVEWIQNQSGPWSLYLNFQAGHFPYRLAAGVAEPFQPTVASEGHLDYFGYDDAIRDIALNRYKNALAYLDAQIGALRDYLEGTGQLENTLWIVTSDHGELFREHGLVTHGRSLFEEEARVPLLLHWPDRLEPQVVAEPVSHLDVMPTLLELMDVPVHPSFQGRSMAPELRLKLGTNPDEPVHAARVEPEAHEAAINERKPAVSLEPPKSVRGATKHTPRAILMNIQGLTTMQGIVCWPWKLTMSESNEALELYHLGDDAAEQHEVTARHPEVARRLAEVLDGAIDAQLRYHLGPALVREQRFAPRLPSCPALPTDAGSASRSRVAGGGAAPAKQAPKVGPGRHATSKPNATNQAAPAPPTGDSATTDSATTDSATTESATTEGPRPKDEPASND